MAGVWGEKVKDHAVAVWQIEPLDKVEHAWEAKGHLG
jgi:hypothetical protein